MGLLVDGKWQTDWYDTKSTGGEFIRKDAQYRHWIGEPGIEAEADWRLFTTLIRFDAVYFSHFKTNLRRIEDYHNLSNYLRDLFQTDGIADTVDFNHIKTHYYFSQTSINPTQIVPVGPMLDFTRGHNRDQFVRAE